MQAISGDGVGIILSFSTVFGACAVDPKHEHITTAEAIAAAPAEPAGQTAAIHVSLRTIGPAKRNLNLLERVVWP